VAGWLLGPNLHRPRRNEEDARDQAGTSCGPGPAERIRRRWEAGECEAVETVVGVGFVARREKKKKQIPPDKTRDSRTSSGARRCAPRQGRGGRNENSLEVGRAVRRAVAERVLELGPDSRLEVGRTGVEVGVGAVRVWGRAPRLRSG
jgi:hypothetical protein